MKNCQKLRQKSVKKRSLIVGDIHGCYEELKNLLIKMNYNPIEDDLYILGDMINKGPKSLKVLEFLDSIPCYLIKGNHEIALINYAKGMMKWGPHIYFEKLLKEMGNKKNYWLEKLESLPLFIETNDFLIVHGGLNPKQHPRNTEERILTTIRTWDGKGIDLNNEFDPPWFKLYKKNKLVVFGHWAKKGLVFEKNVIGLDTGCVWGGQLSGLSLPEKKLYQVNAKKVYCEITG